MKVRVFTDGACSKNGKTGAKASYACFFPDHKEYSSAGRVPEEENQTNNRGELLGIYHAARIANEKFPVGETTLHIYTDSQYAKNCLTEWLVGWQADNWRTKAGTPVKNRDLIEMTTELLSKFNSYIITYVAAHTGGTDELSKCNEEVDRMAVAVLDPEVATVKLVRVDKPEPIEGLPVEIMGPPIAEGVLVEWCRNNLDKLDSDTLNYTLLQVLTKTLKKRGFDLTKQRLHRSNVFRLSNSNLVAENTNIVKEE
jgi:ribonuclease HI